MMGPDISDRARTILSRLSLEMGRELEGNILPFWFQTMDHQAGGFFGLVDNDGSVDAGHAKGIVMHARHLWAYSSAWLLRRNPLYLNAARHAFEFVAGCLYDQKNKGFWWTVDSQGHPGVRNKVLYGQAFAIYGLARYSQASGDQRALGLAMETFGLMERTGRDQVHGAYYEAVDEAWTGPVEQALSEVDIPCSKSMNTNLHVLEAYSALFLASGNPAVEKALADLLRTFSTRIMVSPVHTGLYFDRTWKNLTTHRSFGHDIEASWLMAEAGEIVHGHALSPELKETCLAMARKTLELLQAHGGSLPPEEHEGHISPWRIWWVQAETIVGLVNAWELSGDEAYLLAAERVWDFVAKFMVDRRHGEWFWQVGPDGSPDTSQPKGGLWKTSYHNGRACMEVIQRAARHGITSCSEKEHR